MIWLRCKVPGISGGKYSAFCNLMLPMQQQENQAVLGKDKQEDQSASVTGVQGWGKGVLPQGSIRRKIGAGYALAVGIAILGTTAGLVTGEYYQQQAIAQHNRAHEQEHLLRELKMALLQARSHASRFPVVLGNSVWLQYENQGFKQSLLQAEQALAKTKTFIDHSDNRTLRSTRELQHLLQTYSITISAYGRLSESLLQQINATNLKPDELLSAQQHLLRNHSGEVEITLDRISQQLTQQILVAQAQDRQAFATLQRAGELRVRIIVASMLLSIVIAAILALYTSQAIAQPIRSVTNVAQQVAEESNFTLRAPITTSDEVGVLATSLNQLIHRIAVYTEELKQAEVQLIQTEKMSSLGAMVAGIAHEINNPVNFIYGNLDYATNYFQDLLTLLHLYQQNYPVPNSEIQNQLDEIDFDFLARDLPKILSSMKDGTNRIREIVLSLRNFSRLDEAGMKLVNIHEGIDNTLLILNSRLKRGIEVIKQYGDLPLVECAPAQLNQVFMNLLCNAIDAIASRLPADTALAVANANDALKMGSGEEDTGNSALTASPRHRVTVSSTIPTIWIRTEVVNQDWVVIKIADNGSGIPPAIKGRIFDPFFTTKEPGKGTGLGLAISYQIIIQHHGKIEVNSTPEQGTEFTITLPILEPNKPHR
jgi:two-component system, NtrC family, sensor kinase